MHALPARLGYPLPGFTPPKTYAAWPVWSDSARAEVKFQPIAKGLANRYYQKARAWNRTQKISGRYGGALGSAALRVLESLIFDFLNFGSGRCDPSYEAIARKTGLGRSTVAVALARLKKLRIIHWLRRCVEHWAEGRFELRQDTNAYGILPPSQWFSFVDPSPSPPPPDPTTWGAAPPLPPLIEQAAAETDAGGSLAAVASLLESDPADGLALALARLGRRFSEANS
jgi:hypothetical protein